MSYPFRRLTALAAIFLVCALPLCAQHKSSANAGINTLAAPVPAPLLNGKRVFVSYELGDVTSFPSRYSGSPERAYGELIAEMKTWGRYQIVADPTDADLIFAIRFVDPPELPRPQIRLGIYDPRSHASLWGFVEEIDFAFLKKNRDADFSATVHKLVSDVQALLATSAIPRQP